MATLLTTYIFERQGQKLTMAASQDDPSFQALGEHPVEQLGPDWPGNPVILVVLIHPLPQ